MTVYKTNFKRFNFFFDPVLKQSIDIIFQVDSVNPSNSLLLETALENLEKQYPAFSDDSSNIDGITGWSSVIPSAIERLDVENVSIEDLGIPGEGMPRIGETFSMVMERYTDECLVDGFYKEFVKKESGNKVHDTLIRKLEDKLSERNKGTISIIKCERNEAEFISSSSGGIYPVSKVKVDGLAEWFPREIKKRRDEYHLDGLDMPFRIDI